MASKKSRTGKRQGAKKSGVSRKSKKAAKKSEERKPIRVKPRGLR